MIGTAPQPWDSATETGVAMPRRFGATDVVAVAVLIACISVLTTLLGRH
ncbi:hypothetical protein ACQEVM_19240 [Streptomyces sp. CA-243310]